MRTKIKKMRIGDKIIIYSNQYNKTDQVGYYGKITIVRRKDTGNFNVYVQGVRGMFTHIKKPTKK